MEINLIQGLRGKLVIVLQVTCAVQCSELDKDFNTHVNKLRFIG